MCWAERPPGAGSVAAGRRQGAADRPVQALDHPLGRAGPGVRRQGRRRHEHPQEQVDHDARPTGDGEADEIELASEAFERLVEITQPAGTDWALGTQARSRALLSDGESADRLYQDAIDRLGRTRLRPEVARAHLLYGEWLRREGRRVDAREQLRTAYNLFIAIGMEAFAERARGELMATGEKVRKRSPDTRDAVVATQVRQDLRNPDARDAAEGRGTFSAPEVTVVKLDQPSPSVAGGVNWGDAGIGAGTMLALMLVLGSTLVFMHRRHGAPARRETARTG